MDIVCEDNNKRAFDYFLRQGYTVCRNLTAVDGSCNFCGTKTSDPRYPCSLGCIELPRSVTTTIEGRNEFIEPGSCEWNRLRSKQVWECSSLKFYHDSSLPDFVFIIFYSTLIGTCGPAVANMGLQIQ